MNWLANANSLNKLRARIVPQEPFRGYLFGFKFHFRGRWSRKQRANSLVVSKGDLPLTTMAATIDYGFATVPLANSLVSVRVWFFKSSCWHNRYLLSLCKLTLMKNPSFYRHSWGELLKAPPKKRRPSLRFRRRKIKLLLKKFHWLSRTKQLLAKRSRTFVKSFSLAKKPMAKAKFFNFYAKQDSFKALFFPRQQTTKGPFLEHIFFSKAPFSRKKTFRKSVNSFFSQRLKQSKKLPGRRQKVFVKPRLGSFRLFKGPLNAKKKWDLKTLVSSAGGNFFLNSWNSNLPD